MIRLLALATVVAAFAGQAAAQSASVSVDQLSRPAGSATSATQIGPAGRAVPAAAPSDRQVGTDSPTRPFAVERPQPVVQLGNGGRSADAGVQMTRGAPNANALSSGTERVAGLDTSADRLRGDDRCDPRADRGRSDACARVIETRSAEFQSPDVNPLSPEQRLMVAQRELNERSSMVNDAVRRLGNGDVDDTNAGIVVSALTAQQPPEEETDDVGQPSATEAIISAVLGGIGVTPPQ